VSAMEKVSCVVSRRWVKGRRSLLNLKPQRTSSKLSSSAKLIPNVGRDIFYSNTYVRVLLMDAGARNDSNTSGGRIIADELR